MNAYGEEFRFQDGVLYVRLSGEFPNELLRQTENVFSPLIDACSTHKCNKALIDAIDLEVNLGTLGLFRAGEDAAALARLNLCVAFVAREHVVDPFFAAVAANRGGNIGVFTDVEAARAWLQR